jgi:hypothetical protein
MPGAAPTNLIPLLHQTNWYSIDGAEWQSTTVPGTDMHRSSLLEVVLLIGTVHVLGVQLYYLVLVLCYRKSWLHFLLVIKI